MTTTYETVGIAKCPKCGAAHEYRLKVSRETIVGLATQPQFSRQVSFQISLPCPQKNQSYQATVHLRETGMNPISGVDVVESEP